MRKGFIILLFFFSCSQVAIAAVVHIEPSRSLDYHFSNSNNGSIGSSELGYYDDSIELWGPNPDEDQYAYASQQSTIDLTNGDLHVEVIATVDSFNAYAQSYLHVRFELDTVSNFFYEPIVAGNSMLLDKYYYSSHNYLSRDMDQPQSGTLYPGRYTFLFWVDNAGETEPFNITFDVTSVPIPSAACLLFTGLIGLATIRHKYSE